MPIKLNITDRPVYDLAHHPIKDTITMLTQLVETIISTNDRLSIHSTTQPPMLNQEGFHARSIPAIDIESYLLRILYYCPCANECFLSLLVYFDRMAVNPSTRLRIDSYNIHRLIIIGIMLASKVFSDIVYTNTRYAKVGGLPVQELNRLEWMFLQMNNFALHINVDELQKYGDQLWRHYHHQQQPASHIE